MAEIQRLISGAEIEGMAKIYPPNIAQFICAICITPGKQFIAFSGEDSLNIYTGIVEP
jgi:hypothetical protein